MNFIKERFIDFLYGLPVLSIVGSTFIIMGIFFGAMPTLDVVPNTFLWEIVTWIIIVLATILFGRDFRKYNWQHMAYTLISWIGLTMLFAVTANALLTAIGVIIFGLFAQIANDYKEEITQES